MQVMRSRQQPKASCVVMARSVRIGLIAFAVVCASRASFADDAPAAKSPNVVVFLADDLGWGDLGCYGHPSIRTPHLDAFARSGMRFTQCYSAASVCSPSRSSILTGRTPYRNGVFAWIPEGRDLYLRRSEISLPRLVKERGYATCHVGKWHLNGKFNSTEQPQPGDHGYDWWFATQNNAAPSHRDPDNFVRNGAPVGELRGFSAVLVVDEAIRWLREHRDPARPFFLAVWTHEPHLPIESDPRFQELYASESDEGIRQHHGNVTQLDQAFGKLMATLGELELADSTFVAFTSDNGPEGDGERGRTRGSTGGLRGRKRALYEGGIRVPGIVRWPGRVPAGATCDVPIIGSDVFSTVCEVAGAPLPADRVLDGVSVVPLFSGGTIERRTPLYWRYGDAPHGLQVAMRRDSWKILASESLDRFELYDLAADPHETRDLVASRPERFAALRRELLEVNAAVEAEGPSGWRTWFGDRGANATRAGPAANPAAGVDRTGEFDDVRGATVTKHADGYSLESSGEGFALWKLAKPATKRLVVTASYRTLRAQGTRNAFLVFAAAPELSRAAPELSRLVQVGSAIGMGTHAAFAGGWSRLAEGRRAPMAGDASARVEVRVTVDFASRTLHAVVGGAALDLPLPADWKQITAIGYYVKGSRSAFSAIETVESE